MALSKSSNKNSSTIIDLFPLSSNNGSERIKMTLNVEAMGKIMDRLTDLYTDPIQATVREIISNALDSTSKARKEGKSVNPVRITLPNSLDPVFTVEDSGVGMSRDFVKEVFAQYGASTKEKELDQTGSFGLGAKAPLAYTNEFYFTTVKDGIETDVAVTRYDSGPETNILSVNKTTKPSGTIMRVPVQLSSHDFNEFEKNVNVYRDYAFTMNEEIIIDNNLIKDNEDYHLFDSIVIEKEDNVYGRVWMNKNSVNRIIKSINAKSHDKFGLSIGYALSGYLYKDPSPQLNVFEYNYEDADSADLIVELKPSIVEFSSSRDQIMKDDRFNYFNNLIKEQLFTGEYFIANFVSYVKNLKNDSEVYSIFKSMVYSQENDQIIFSVNSKNFDSQSVSKSFDIHDLSSESGYNMFLENQKFSNESYLLGAFTPAPYVNNKINVIDIFRNHDEKDNSKYKVIACPKITDVKERFIKSLHDKKITSSWIQTAQNIVSGLKKSNAIRNVLIISEVNSSKEISSVLRNRNKAHGSNSYVLLSGYVSEDLKKAVEMRVNTENSSVEYEYITFNDFVKNIKEHQKEVALQKTENNSYCVEARVFDPIASTQDIYSFDDKYSYNLPASISLDVNEYLGKNALFVPNQSLYIANLHNIINGAFHVDGEKIFNRPIVLVKDPKKDFFEIVKEPSSYIVSSTYSARSSLAKEILKDRVFQRNVNIDQAAIVSESYRLAVYYLINNHSLKPSAYLGIKGTENDVVNKTLMLVQSIIDSSSSSENLLILKEVLDNVVNEEYSDIDIAPNLDLLTIQNSLSDEKIDLYNIKNSFLKEIFNKSLGYGYNYRTSASNEFSTVCVAFNNTKSDVLKTALANRIDEIVGEELSKHYCN